MSEIDSALKEGNIKLYPFYQHVKRHIPEMIAYTCSEEWDEVYRDIVNKVDMNNKDLIVYLPFNNCFFVIGQMRKKFLESNVFEYFKHNENGVDNFLKAFDIILQITNASAFVEFDLERKQFFFMTDSGSLFKKEHIYFIDSEYKEIFNKNRSFESTYYYTMRDINEIIEPILNKKISDIDELTSEDLLLLEMISV